MSANLLRTRAPIVREGPPNWTALSVSFCCPRPYGDRNALVQPPIGLAHVVDSFARVLPAAADRARRAVAMHPRAWVIEGLVPHIPKPNLSDELFSRRRREPRPQPHLDNDGGDR